MTLSDKFASFMGRKMPLPPDHVPGREYQIEVLRNAPTESPYTPVDWTPINRYEKYSDIIEVKPDNAPGGMVSRLCGDGWEIIAAHKNSLQIGKLKPT